MQTEAAAERISFLLLQVAHVHHCMVLTISQQISQIICVIVRNPYEHLHIDIAMYHTVTETKGMRQEQGTIQQKHHERDACQLLVSLVVLPWFMWPAAVPLREPRVGAAAVTTSVAPCKSDQQQTYCVTYVQCRILINVLTLQGVQASKADLRLWRENVPQLCRASTIHVTCPRNCLLAGHTSRCRQQRCMTTGVCLCKVSPCHT